jgi:hypothetical protein
MAQANRHPETEEKGTGKSSALALLANGSSGRWSVTLDESTEGTEEWCLQIEAPLIRSIRPLADLEAPTPLLGRLSAARFTTRMSRR